jgi:hypothetical protein
VRFEVPRAICTRIAVFWAVALYDPIKTDACFGEVYCLHHEGDDRQQAALRHNKALLRVLQGAAGRLEQLRDLTVNARVLRYY